MKVTVLETEAYVQRSEELLTAEEREGTRIAYFYALSDRVIVLLYAYSKDEKEDLTNVDRKNLKAAADEVKAAVAKSKPRPDDEARRRTRKRS